MNRARKTPNIVGFTGYWGEGKSYMMCEEIVRREQLDPQLVIGSTFDYKSPNAILLRSLEDVVEFAAWPLPGRKKLLALDELGMIARASMGRVLPPAADVVFMQGRKLGLSVMWSTTHWRNVDVSIRRVTDRLLNVRGHLWKRVTPRGVTPVEWRPRIMVAQVYESPDPESSSLPKKSDGVQARLFRQEVADRYDTFRLVESASMLMREQVRSMEASIIAEALGRIGGA